MARERIDFAPEADREWKTVGAHTPSDSSETTPAAPGLTEALAVLKSVWNYPDFRYHQRKTILAALNGRDCLAVLPTGGGKSLCFQVPALVLRGLTLVISPLISLMEDQVGTLEKRGVAAAYLSSTQRPAEQRAVREAMQCGRLKLLYVAPERVQQLVGGTAPLKVSFLAIDEAHCISEWGHDFRPHFRALGALRKAMGRPPTLAVTATATPETCSDIIRVLDLVKPVQVAQSFDRPNLFFSARHFRHEGNRVREAARLLRASRGTAIVYVPTRDRTDGVATLLRRWGFRSAPYHAGLPASARSALLTQFVGGQIDVMIATNAFGMGIDKPDVRLVIHLGIPSRPEAYFQEAGRAGRDGEPSRCEMLWTKGDLVLAARMADVNGRRPHGAAASHWDAKRRGLRTMRSYVHTHRCRRRVLLGYLGERLKRCSGCDRCGKAA
ncbi:RecQ family ATP-dependent DNA helicase [Gemmatimonadota bacterium]